MDDATYKSELLKEAAKIKAAFQLTNDPSDRDALRRKYNQIDIQLEEMRTKLSDTSTPLLPPDSHKPIAQSLVSTNRPTGSRMRDCPYCLEQIVYEARACKFCGRVSYNPEALRALELEHALLAKRLAREQFLAGVRGIAKLFILLATPGFLFFFNEEIRIVGIIYILVLVVLFIFIVIFVNLFEGFGG